MRFSLWQARLRSVPFTEESAENHLRVEKYATLCKQVLSEA